jgi:hypothetical protein
MPGHKSCHVERFAHPRRERLTALLFGESGGEPQQQRLDGVPDEPPQHVEEQNSLGDRQHRLSVRPVTLKETGGPSGYDGDQPEDGQPRVEDQCAAEYPIRRAAAVLERRDGGGRQVGDSHGGVSHGRREMLVHSRSGTVRFTEFTASSRRPASFIVACQWTAIWMRDQWSADGLMRLRERVLSLFPFPYCLLLYPLTPQDLLSNISL